MAEYFLDSGLVSTKSFEFQTDKEAWEHLRLLLKRYKSGSIDVYMYKMVRIPINNEKEYLELYNRSCGTYSNGEFITVGKTELKGKIVVMAGDTACPWSFKGDFAVLNEKPQEAKQ